MIKFLIKMTVKDRGNLKDENVKKSYGILSGTVGIICNLTVFLLKLFSGIYINSIAVISESFNNLTDCISSVLTIFTSSFSSKKPSERHPYGYKRTEYISSFAIACMMIFVGGEFFFRCAEKMIKKEGTELDVFSVIILVFSVIIKIWMYSYNKYIGNLIDSPSIKAISKENGNDVISSIGVLFCSVISKLSPLADGFFGMLVSGYFVYSGIKILLEAFHKILGQSDDLLKQSICDFLKNECKTSDFLLDIHDYGPGKSVVYVILFSPDVNTEKIEEELSKKFGISSTVAVKK